MPHDVPTSHNSKAEDIFHIENEYLKENDKYEEALELNAIRNSIEVALKTLIKGGVACKVCQP